MAYWYNVDTGQVETDDDKSQGANLMGPYDTPEEAANALEIARKRSKAWDDDDKAWGGEDS